MTEHDPLAYWELINEMTRPETTRRPLEEIAQAYLELRGIHARTKYPHLLWGLVLYEAISQSGAQNPQDRTAPLMAEQRARATKRRAGLVGVAIVLGALVGWLAHKIGQ